MTQDLTPARFACLMVSRTLTRRPMWSKIMKIQCADMMVARRAWSRRARAIGQEERGTLAAPIHPRACSTARQQHAVDHVDHAVRLEHVLDRDLGGVALGVPDRERVALGLDGEFFALDGLELGAAAVLLGGVHQVLGGETAGHD